MTTTRTAKLTVAMRRNTRSAKLILIIEEDLLAVVDVQKISTCGHRATDTGC
jgi:hypothetical protein